MRFMRMMLRIELLLGWLERGMVRESEWIQKRSFSIFLLKEILLYRCWVSDSKPFSFWRFSLFQGSCSNSKHSGSLWRKCCYRKWRLRNGRWKWFKWRRSESRNTKSSAELSSEVSMIVNEGIWQELDRFTDGIHLFPPASSLQRRSKRK